MYCYTWKLRREERADHEAEREGTNDRLSNGDSRELNVSKMSDKYISKRVHTILTDYVEGYRTSYPPQLNTLNAENSPPYF